MVGVGWLVRLVGEVLVGEVLVGEVGELVGEVGLASRGRDGWLDAWLVGW